MTNEPKLDAPKATEFVSRAFRVEPLHAKVVGDEVHLLLGSVVYVIPLATLVELASFATMQFADWAQKQKPAEAKP